MKHSLYIYHYSNKLFDTILTKEQQSKAGINSLSKEVINKEDDRARFRSSKYPRYNETSFMIDELPFDVILNSRFDPNHTVYKKGATIYCYEINVLNLPQMHWRLTESPTDTFIRHFWIENEFYKRIFFKMKNWLKIIEGNENEDLSKLIKTVRKYKGSYNRYFKRWVNSKSFINESNMYAATIPHIQLYPVDGIIEFEKVTKINL